MTWAQLGEMRDAGVDLEAHTVSHHDLRHAPMGQDYTTWLHNEVYGCKETLENKLGVKIIAFAFPYGFHNEVVRKTAKEAGYEMQFTVYGRHMDINVPADQIGRYAIDSLKNDVFKAALDFGTTDSTQPGVETSQLASAAMLTEPLNDQHITEPKPTIKANLASMGDVDPKSVEMRISGLGLVPASTTHYPRNSVRTARKAKTAGIPILSVKNAIDEAKPEPPNQPRTFWAPCGNITTARNTRNTSGPTDPEVWNRLNMILFIKLLEQCC